MAQQTSILLGEAEERPAPPPDRSVLGRTTLRSTPGIYRRAWHRFRRDRVALFGLVLTMVILIFALGANILSQLTGYTYWRGELGDQFVAPFNEGHLLGTDTNGRDVLVRLAYGGRVSLLVAGLAALTTLFIGGTVGAVAGFFGGAIDTVRMRTVDVLLSIPGLPILILISVLYRPGVIGLAIIIALLIWPGVSRLIRGEVLARRSSDYVDAARVIGAPNSRIILRHIIPNVIPTMVVWISLAIPGLILTEATLSFLGFGVQIPTPSWGNMLDGATDYYAKSWTNVFIPGFMIWITVLAINLIGNGLRDALDPRLSE